METLKSIINSSNDSVELYTRLVGIQGVYQKQTSIIAHKTQHNAIVLYGFVKILLIAFYIDVTNLEEQKAFMYKKISQYEALYSEK